ncbi:MAG: hypothetical protein ACREC6_07885 [Hyphomicrobiaceae bacterium]
MRGRGFDTIGGLIPPMLVAVLVLPVCGQLGARPLDKEACDKLKADIVRMEKAGVAANKARGPVWAKANLAQDKLDEIKRLIEAEEQVAFRCPQPKPQPDPVVTAQPAPDGKKRVHRKNAARPASAAKAKPAIPAEPKAKSATPADPKANPKPAPKAQSKKAAPKDPVSDQRSETGPQR